jgi:hypothetical protein
MPATNNFRVSGETPELVRLFWLRWLFAFRCVPAGIAAIVEAAAFVQIIGTRTRNEEMLTTFRAVF